MKRFYVGLILTLCLAGFLSVFAVVSYSESGASDDETPGEQWEYLVVAGANNNLTPSGNPSMRKEASRAFGREAFVLEQNMDKLGSRGWELVTVAGSTSDPIFYFKRRK